MTPVEYQYACVKLKNGQFRLVDNPEECNPSEFLVIIDVNEDSQLNGEMCWLNSSGDCTLTLRFKRQGSSYSLTGNEICNENDVTILKHVYGSGYENNDELKIGLTYTGINRGTERINPGIIHEGSVLAMDLASGFGLVRYRESNYENECADNPVPCVVQESYTPIECP